MITLIDLNDYTPRFINEPLTAVLDKFFFTSLSTAIIWARAFDLDKGDNGTISYSLLKIDQKLGNQQTMLTVSATDGGNPSLSGSTIITVEFFSPCLVQEYTIDSLTGVVFGKFLCGVDIQPPKQELILNSTTFFICTVLHNVPEAIIRLLHNRNFAGDEVVLSHGEVAVTFERLSTSFANEGTYECIVTSVVGNAVSNASSVFVTGTHCPSFKITSCLLRSSKMTLIFVCLSFFPIYFRSGAIIYYCSRGWSIWICCADACTWSFSAADIGSKEIQVRLLSERTHPIYP